MPIDENRYKLRRREMAYVLSDFMVPYLLRLYHAFDGDLAEIVVLGEIAQRNASRVFSQAGTGGTKEHLLDDESRRLDHLVPCNALSVADSTGIPRETVRRKVKKLIARGWIAREADGYLYATPAVGDQFEAFNLKTFNDLLETAQRLEQLGGIEKPGTSVHCGGS